MRGLFFLFMGLAAAGPTLRAGVAYEPLAGFEAGSVNPSRGNLVLHSDGNFYGVAGRGRSGFGTIFQVTKAGVETKMVDFTGTAGTAKGSYSRGGLVEDAAGYLWGTTYSGGAQDFGAIFKFHPTTKDFVTVAEFTGGSGPNSGIFPAAGLTSDGNGFFWGTTEKGGKGAGADGLGTVFKIEAATNIVTTVVEFTGATGNAPGAYPDAELASDGLGALWGTTAAGGTQDYGTVFKIVLSNETFSSKVSLNNGRNPQSALALDGLGNLWGTTLAGGTNQCGTVYRIKISDGTLTGEINLVGQGTGVLQHNRGAFPQSALVNDGNGNLWGTTRFVGAPEDGDYFGTIYKLNLAAGNITTVKFFDDTPGSVLGMYPESGLVSDGSGGLWGTTFDGGKGGSGTVYKVDVANGNFTTMDNLRAGAVFAPLSALVSDGSGFFWGTAAGGTYPNGTIYKMDAATRTVTKVVEFTGKSGAAKGSLPVGGLWNDGNGFLWGTTAYGGSDDFGTVYKVNTNTGVVTTIFEFQGMAQGGSIPQGPLVDDGNGKLWGTTLAGGGTTPDDDGDGTYFSVTRSTGQVQTFYLSTQSGIGYFPAPGLVNDGTGRLWGATTGGSLFDRGCIFKVNATPGANPAAARVTTFTGHTGSGQGKSPNGPLVRDNQGSLWGTTKLGSIGKFDTGLGTIFKVNIQTGLLTTLAEFSGDAGRAPGGYPLNGMVRDGSGNFWGIAQRGGPDNRGSIFRITPQGVFTKVFDFTGISGAAPGDEPDYGNMLMLHTDGNLYGVTAKGGVLADGTPAGSGQIFRIVLTAPDATITSPKAGERLTGTGPITFSGTATDNTRVVRVEAVLNGGAPQILTNPDPTAQFAWSFSTLPENGINTLVVTAYDDEGHVSQQVVRTFIFVHLRPEIAGVYHGLLEATGASPTPIDHEGLVTVSVLPSGAFTGKIFLSGTNFILAGSLLNDGSARFGKTATQTLALSKKVGSMTVALGELTLTLDSTPGADRFTGTLQQGALTLAALDHADRALYTAKKNALAPFLNVPMSLADPLANKGRYTGLFHPGTAGSGFPQGQGWVTMNIAATGMVKIVGKLADGSPVSYSNALSKTNTLPLFVPLYVRTGWLGGTVAFDPSQPTTDASGIGLRWFKRANAKDRLYPAGWLGGITTDFAGSKFVVPSKPTTANPTPVYVAGTHNILGLVAAPTPAALTVRLEEGGILDLANDAMVDVKSKVTIGAASAGATGATGLKATLNAATGALLGSFLDPANSRTTAFSGVVFQKTHTAGGYFIHFPAKPPGLPAPSGTSGSVNLAP